MALVPARYLEAYDASIIPALSSAFSSTQMTSAIIIDEYSKNCITKDLPARFISYLHKIIDEERPLHYRDLVSATHLVRNHCLQMLNTFRDVGKVPQSKLPTLAVVVQGEPEAGPDAFSIATAEKCVGADYDRLTKLLSRSQSLTAGKSTLESKPSPLPPFFI